MLNPLRRDQRESPDGSDSYENESDTAQNEASQQENVPEVKIQPSPETKKEKTAAKRSKEESVSKSSEEPEGGEGTNQEKSKELEFKKFDISELDSIFANFKTTFDPFVQNRQELEKSEDSFKKAVRSLGAIHPHASFKEYIVALKTRLKDEGITVKIKEGAMTIYKEGGAMVKGISDAVSAINAMLKLEKDLKEMPLTIEKGSADAVDRADRLDVQEILKREFHSMLDFGKIPKLKKAFSNNVKQIRGAPKMVRDFHRKVKEIILEIYHAFADEEDKKKMKEEMAKDDEESNEEDKAHNEDGAKKKKKKTTKEKGADGKNKSNKEKEKDEFHEKVKFESVGLVDVDNLFTTVAITINPFVETRERLQAARESFEKVVKTICNFDGKKELKDYIKELKKDAKEGDITIYINEEDGQIKVKSVKGVKPPKPYRDAVQALENIRTSGKQTMELEPHVQHGIEDCVDRVKQIDPRRDFHSLLKKKTDLLTLPGKIKKFNDNRKKVQEIPGIVKEFCLYVEHLLKDILEALTGEKEVNPEERQGERGGKEGYGEDEEDDEKDKDGDKKGKEGGVEDEDVDEKGEDGDQEDEDVGKKGEDGDQEDEDDDEKDNGVDIEVKDLARKDEGYDKKDEGAGKKDEGGVKESEDGHRKDERGETKNDKADKEDECGDKKNEADDTEDKYFDTKEVHEDQSSEPKDVGSSGGKEENESEKN